MSETITIRIDLPLPCCALVAMQRRCNRVATFAQVARLVDGSYHLQPFCWTCVAAMAQRYGVDLNGVDVKGDEE